MEPSNPYQFDTDAFANSYLQGFGGVDTQFPEEDPWEVNLGRIVLAGMRGYASGFLALPPDEVATNNIERLAQQAGSLAGFIGLGFPAFGRVAAGSLRGLAGRYGQTAALDAVTKFRGVPMLAADAVLRGVNKSQMFKHLNQSVFKGNLMAKQLSQVGVHLGTASFVSSLHAGVGEAGMAGLHGMALGVVTGGIGNLPILKERTTVAGILRAGSGAAVNLGMMGEQINEAHWTDIAFQGVLGAYFGYVQPTAAMSEAQTWISQQPRHAWSPKTGNLNRDWVRGDDSGFSQLPKEVQSEVLKIFPLYDSVSVQGGLSRIFKKQIDAEPKLKPLTPKDRPVLDWVHELTELQQMWPTPASSPRSLQSFVMRVKQEGKGFAEWRESEMGRMILSLGEKARTEGLDYPAFKESVKSKFEEVDIKWDGWQENDLHQFYNEKMSAVRKAMVTAIQYDAVPREMQGTVPRSLRYKMAPVSDKGRDTGGNLLSDYGPRDHMMMAAKGARIVDDFEQAYFIMEGFKPAGRRGKEDLSRMPEEFTAELMNPREFFGEEAAFSVPKLGVNRGQVEYKLFDENGDPRYYAAHGLGTKDRVYFLRHFFENNRFTEDQYTRVLNEMGEKVGDRNAVAASADKDYRMFLEVSRQEHSEQALRDWKMQVVSNANWFKAVQMGGGEKALNLSLASMKDGHFVSDLGAFNKRLQPLQTTFYPVPKDIMPEVRYMVAEDASAYIEAQSKGQWGAIDAEITDGATLITRSMYDRLAAFMGLEKKGTSVKAFMLDDGITRDREGTEVMNNGLGMMMGKTALHIASRSAEKMMQAHGLDMIVMDSAAKQRGFRGKQAVVPSATGKGFDFGNVLRGPDGKTLGVEWGKTPEIHKMSGEHIFVSSTSYDKSKQGLEILKQMHNTIVPELIGKNEKGEWSRSAAKRQMDQIDREVLESAIVGTTEANKALRRFNRSGSEEDMEVLFNADRGRPLIEDANPLEVLEILSKPGNEKAFGRFVEKLVKSDEAQELMARDDGDKSYMDDGEMEGARFIENDSVADRMIALSGGRIGPLAHKAAFSRMDSMISHWLINKLTRPYHKSGMKSVMKPYDFGLWTEIGYNDGGVRYIGEGGKRTEITPVSSKTLTEDNYFIEGGAFKNNKVPIATDSGRIEHRTIESLWTERAQLEREGYGQTSRAFQIDEALSSTSYRSPAIDPSAGRVHKLGGKGVDDRGYGVLLHGKTMRAEGGADLDIDTTAIYWGLPKVLQDAVKMNKNGQEKWNEVGDQMRAENRLPKEWKRVNAYMSKPRELLAVQDGATAADKLFGMFSSHQRVRLGLEVARGRNEFVSGAVSNRNIIHALYSAVNDRANRTDVFNITKDGSIKMEFEARGDNGARLRALADAATTAGVDVAAYGALVSRTDLTGSLLNAAFRRIKVIKNGREVFQLTDNDARLTREGSFLFEKNAEKFLRGKLEIDGIEIGPFMNGSPLGKIRRTNQGLYGRNHSEGRAWRLEERNSLINWPEYYTDVGERTSMPTTLGTIGNRLREGIKNYRNPTILGHALEHFQNFDAAQMMMASGLKNEGRKLFDFAYLGTPDQKRRGDGSFVEGGVFPQVSYAGSGIRAILQMMHQAGKEGSFLKVWDTFDTYKGRQTFARNDRAWERLERLVRETGIYKDMEKGFFAHRPPESAGKNAMEEWRMAKVSELHRRVTDFISNDMEDPVALMTMRDFYHMSGLRKNEANTLLRKAMSVRNRAAKEFMTSRDTPGTEKEYREKQASAKAQIMARDEYADYAEGGGLLAFVEKVNQNRGAGDPVVSYDKARDFFDAAMLSPYHISSKDGKGLEWKTSNRTFGFSLVSPRVLQTFLDNYSRTFDYVMHRPPSGEASFREFVEASPFLKEKTALREVVTHTELGLDTHADKTIKPEVQAEVSKLHENAMLFPAFRKNPKGFLEWLTREHAGVLQLSDLTLADIKSANRTLTEWRKGTGLLRWWMNKNHGESKAAEVINPIMMSMFSPRVLGDHAMAKDLMLVDQHFGANKPVMVKHYTEHPDGRVTVDYVPSKITKAFSTMNSLVDIHGEQLPRLVASGQTDVIEDLNRHTAWMRGDMTSTGSGKDHKASIMDYAIKDMEHYASTFDKTGKGSQTEGQFAMSRGIARAKLANELGLKKGESVEDARVMWTSKEGNPVNGAMQDLVLEIQGSLRQGFAKVRDKYLLADEWFGKNLDAIVDPKNGEIRLEFMERLLDDVMGHGVASEQLPLDVARFLFHEDVVREVAATREYAPLTTETLTNGGRVKKTLDDLGISIPLVTRHNVEEVAREIRRHIKKNMTKEEIAPIEEAADYFHKEWGRDDMRKQWMQRKFDSPWTDDLLHATGRLSSDEYARRRVREEYPLMSTRMEDGYWPHLDFDPQKAGDHLIRWIRSLDKPKAGHKPRSKEDAVKQAEALRDVYNEALGRATDPDGRTLDAVAALHIEKNPESFLKEFSKNTTSLARRKLNLDGYRTDLGVIQMYSQKLAQATYGNIASLQSRKLLKSFEERAPMGEFTGAWSKWMRIYVRDAMGKPTVFTQDVLDDEHLQLKRTPYYWLSDHALMVSGTGINKALLKLTGTANATRADREVFRLKTGKEMTPADERALRDSRLKELTEINGEGPTGKQAEAIAKEYSGIAELEAKYSLMSLLFHTKTMATNIFGGTTNTVINSGLRNFVDAGRISTWKKIMPEKDFRSMADVEHWVAEQGVVEQWVINELQYTPRYRQDEAYRIAVDKAVDHIKRNPSVKDESIRQILKSSGLSDKLVEIAAKPMQWSERKLRSRAFLSALVQARKTMGPMALAPDHPVMIEMARKAVATSQFLYDAPNRPAFARTNFGKIYSRFKIWSWSSVSMRRHINREAKRYGYEPMSESYQRMRRLVQADMFAVSLASFFPFSIFETAGLPAPYNWLKDASEYFFGEDFERDTAFYGSPLGPFTEVVPSIFSRAVGATDTIFEAMVSDEKETISRYPLVVMFPFGRMANDVYRSLEDPTQAPKYLLGLPLRDFKNRKDTIVRANKLRESAHILVREAIDGASLKEIITAYENEGYGPTQARQAVNDGIKYGLISREMRGNAYRYYTTADDDDIGAIMDDLRRRTTLGTGPGMFLR